MQPRLAVAFGLLLALGAGVAPAASVADAEWIWAEGAATEDTWVALRTEIDLESVPPLAPTRIAVDSKYWLWVNGELVVFEGGLKRGPRPDATWADELDLAPHLQPGANCIAILVWYWGNDGLSHVDSGRGGLFFEADLGGSTVVSGTDWRAIPQPAFLRSVDGPQPNWRLPEHNIRFDARLDAIDGWTLPRFDDSDWPSAVSSGRPPVGPWGELVPRAIPLWRFGDIRDFTELTRIVRGDGDTIVVGRLPYNSQVTAYLELTAPPGLTVDVRTDNYNVGGSTSVRTEYVTKDGSQVFESPGWFNGDEVRFTLPEGVEALRLGYRESGYDTDPAGSFSSSDDLLDELWQKAARTTFVNMRDSFMDCPDRERAQWWGDVVNEMPQAFYAFDPASHALARKAVLDLVEWRKSDVVLHSPVPAGNYDSELPAQMLAAVGLFGFWDYYLHTGDAETISRVFDHVVAYLDLWDEQKTGLVVQRTGDWQWFDWGENIDGEVIENAWYALALQGAVEMSKLVGATGTTAGLEARLARLAAGFELQFWSGASYRSPGHTGPPDDRANALAVLAGLVPDEHRSAVRSVLTEERHASPYMERFVLEALFRLGFDEAALDRMRVRFGPMVLAEGSTLWESWDPAVGSDNHGWSGGGLILLSAEVVGIAPVSPGWERARVVPRLGGLERAAGTVATIRGTVTVSHRRTDREHVMELRFPTGMTGLVAVPAKNLGGGLVATVTVDGIVVWDRGVPHDVPGVRFIGADAERIVFEFAAGDWSLAASTPAGHIFSDGFESGNLSAWSTSTSE
jgi:alpha-L-rhamnosidase